MEEEERDRNERDMRVEINDRKRNRHEGKRTSGSWRESVRG